MKFRVILPLIVLLLAILATLTLIWKALDADMTSASVVVIYFPGVDDSEFSETEVQQWENSDMALLQADNCDSDVPESRQYLCFQQWIQKPEFKGRKLALILGNEYAGLLQRALQDPNVQKFLAAVILLRADAQAVLKENHASTHASRVLTLTLASDPPEIVQESRQFAAQLREQGVWSWFSMLVPAQVQGFRLNQHPVLKEMLSYLLFEDSTQTFALQFKAESFWQTPPLDNDRFLQQHGHSKTYSVDSLFLRTLHTFYQSEPFLLKQWPLENYRALDLLQLRESLPKAKQGRYVAMSNHKGHQFFIDLNRYGRYQPVIVFQIDDEHNLYRLARFYRTRQYYSWQPDKGGPGQNDLYVEPLGAFLHFRKPMPKQYELPLLQYTALQFDSIRYTDQDPYAQLTGMSLDLYRVLSQNCMPCHSVEGAGGNAAHLDAFTLRRREGFALPLRAYSQAVLQEFFFNQQHVADTVGVKPNFIDPEVARELMAWLQR